MTKAEIDKSKRDFERDYARMINDSGDRTQFPTGAVRDMHGGKGRFDLLPWAAIWEVAKHCENGAVKYGERNVNRGIPTHSLLDSAFRHLCRYMEGETDSQEGKLLKKCVTDGIKREFGEVSEDA